MSGFYGGHLFGSFPVPFTEAEARAAVLGGPDNLVLSLPGVDGTPPGEPFPDAYVDLRFGFGFGANTLLNIWEVGDNQETAQGFL